MSPNKADENVTHLELNNHNQAVFVSGNIEHIVLITNGVNTSKVFFHLCKRVPLCRFCNLIPPLQCAF